MSYTGIVVLHKNCTDCVEYEKGKCRYFDQEVTFDDEPCGHWDSEALALLNDSANRHIFPVAVHLCREEYDLSLEEATRLRDRLTDVIRHLEGEKRRCGS